MVWFEGVLIKVIIGLGFLLDVCVLMVIDVLLVLNEYFLIKYLELWNWLMIFMD